MNEILHQEEDGRMMTVHEMAQYLRLSEAKVYQMARDGMIPAVRIGKSWRFKKEMVDEWIRREAEFAILV